MTPQLINIKRKAIEKRRDKAYAELKALHVICPHVNASHVNKASTGNYDPSADSYWTEHKCMDCGWFWTTDQKWDKKNGN